MTKSKNILLSIGFITSILLIGKYIYKNKYKNKYKNEKINFVDTEDMYYSCSDSLDDYTNDTSDIELSITTSNSDMYSIPSQECEYYDTDDYDSVE